VTYPEWSAEDWEPHGSLRDVYVHDTNGADWQRVVDLVGAREWATSYEEDSSPVAMPVSVGEIFERATQRAILWQIEPARGIRVNCHFFHPAEIEFDLDPREVVDEAALHVVCDFVLSIGRVVQKRVVITEENSPEWVIMSYDPATDAVTRTPFHSRTPSTRPRWWCFWFRRR
jgi:hypothetical protein